MAQFFPCAWTGCESALQGVALIDNAPTLAVRGFVPENQLGSTHNRVTCLARLTSNMSGAETMASVALRPWPASARDALSKEDLYQQIAQLTTERGHLRGITEKALQDEIDAGKELPEDVMEAVEQEKKEEAPTARDKLEEIHRVRNEMATKLE